MLILTTPNIEGSTIVHYHGLVTGEAILGANIFRISLPVSETSLAGDRLHMSRSSDRQRTSPFLRWLNRPNLWVETL